MSEPQYRLRPQVYETTVAGRNDEPAFTFISIPYRSLSSIGNVDERMEGLRLAEYVMSWAVDELKLQVVAYGAAPVSEGVLIRAVTQRLRDYANDEGISFDLENWADYLVNQRLIPFEQSPAAGHSLAELVAGLGGGAASLVGALASGDPLLLLTMPAGIIICGVAVGIAEGLRAGLRYRILRIMGVPSQEAVAISPSEPEESGSLSV